MHVRVFKAFGEIKFPPSRAISEAASLLVFPWGEHVPFDFKMSMRLPYRKRRVKTTSYFILHKKSALTYSSEGIDYLIFELGKPFVINYISQTYAFQTFLKLPEASFCKRYSFEFVRRTLFLISSSTTRPKGSVIRTFTPTFYTGYSDILITEFFEKWALMNSTNLKR